MSETFLSRWSRRKREASIPPPQGEGGERSEPGGGSLQTPQAPIDKTEVPPTPDPSPPRFARGEGSGEALASGIEEGAFDPASLPSVESIDAGTDVSAFLRPGVPAELTQAALRRAWVTDPAIRDFVGPAENAWDFNAPGGVPGFEPLRAIDDVQRLAAQVFGTLSAAPAETAPAEGEQTAGPVEARVQSASQDIAPETASAADDAAVQNDQSTSKT